MISGCIEKNRYLSRRAVWGNNAQKHLVAGLMLLMLMILSIASASGHAHADSRMQSNTPPASRRLKRRGFRGKHIIRNQATPSPLPPTIAEAENIRLQRERFEFEKEKDKSDSNRAERALGVEKSKVSLSTLATTTIPLALGLIAIIVGIINQNRQARQQFDLKAAEIIFSGTTPQAIIRRGNALKKIFSKYLSKDFLANLEPKDIGGYTEPVDGKLAFFEQVVKNPSKKGEIVQNWFLLFPGDFRWLVRFDPAQFKNIDLPEVQELLAKLETERLKKAIKES